MEDRSTFGRIIERLTNLKEDGNMKTDNKKRWAQSDRWLVLINPSGYMTCMRANSYKLRDSRYNNYIPFAQIRNANQTQISYAMQWAINNLGA